MTKKKKKTLDILEPYKKWAQLGLVFQNQFKINADQAAKIIENHIFGNNWTKNMWNDPIIVNLWTQVIGRDADIIEEQNTAKNALRKLFEDQVVKNFQDLSGYKFPSFKTFQNLFSQFNKLPMFKNIPQKKYKQTTMQNERTAKKAAAYKEQQSKLKKAYMASELRHRQKNK